MNTNQLRFKVTGGYERAPACLMCGNDKEFVAKAEKVEEGNWYIWVECVCGYDPTRFKKCSRIESDNGKINDRDNISEALVVYCKFVNDQHAWFKDVTKFDEMTNEVFFEKFFSRLQGIYGHYCFLHAKDENLARYEDQWFKTAIEHAKSRVYVNQAKQAEQQ
ncbi:hypothetical protein [Zooshikella ganghwensis]|uniref:Uncharacterized protein n=1 Tax=Zooshikella ganghwensis TaxID=202772 RepID=A0A4V1IMX0_9GAMM|nr:hypothetical protein [Zooshikella ganghwensis]RDH41611.1 hypothetical protein B9G39_27500 [Zooshikella ganghwensis]RDH41701.1 hypothetical protein B9G39_26955 [Zooshikella ganghwensis]